MRQNVVSERSCSTDNHAGWSPLERASESSSTDTYTRATAAAAAVSHFICWRSTPRERRKRMIMLTAESTMVTGTSTKQRLTILSGSSSAEMPSGLTVWGSPLSAIVPGVRISDRVPTTIAKAPARATHRHRGDSRCPSGKSSSRNVPVRVTAGIHSPPRIPAT